MSTRRTRRPLRGALAAVSAMLAFAPAALRAQNVSHADAPAGMPTHEMLEDPTFHVVDMLPSVDNNINATRFNDCEGGPSYFELPDGRTVALTDGGTMPDLEGNPAALRIEQIPMTGPAQVEVDTAALIDGLLDVWNDEQIDGPGPGCAIQGFGARELFAMLGIFGIAWFNRRKRG